MLPKRWARSASTWPLKSLLSYSEAMYSLAAVTTSSVTSRLSPESPYRHRREKRCAYKTAVDHLKDLLPLCRYGDSAESLDVTEDVVTAAKLYMASLYEEWLQWSCGCTASPSFWQHQRRHALPSTYWRCLPVTPLQSPVSVGCMSASTHVSANLPCGNQLGESLSVVS